MADSRSYGSNYYNSGYNPVYYDQGYDFLNPMNFLTQGWNTMSGLGSTIGSQFAFANALNSANRQAQYQPEAQMNSANMNANSNIQQAQINAAAQNRQTDALQQLGNARINQGSTLLPMLISALSGIGRGVGGGGAGLQGFTTNFGQGARLGGAVTPQTPRAIGNT